MRGEGLRHGGCHFFVLESCLRFYNLGHCDGSADSVQSPVVMLRSLQTREAEV